MNGKAIFRGQIVAPPRSSRLGAGLLVLLIVVYGLWLTRALPKGAESWLPRVMWLMFPLAVASRSIYTVHLNLFLVCFFLVSQFPHFTNYPFSHLTLLLLYAYAVMLIPALRGSVGWLKVGKFDARVWMLILVTIVVPSGALMAWVHWFSPDLSRYASTIPAGPTWLTMVYFIGASAFIAAVEEITWRGVMMEALDSAFGPGWCALIIQSISFAVAHYLNGFPNGVLGSLMVVVFGVMLGIIRRKSKGIVAGWIAHMAVDSTIFLLVFWFVHKPA